MEAKTNQVIRDKAKLRERNFVLEAIYQQEVNRQNTAPHTIFEKKLFDENMDEAHELAKLIYTNEVLIDAFENVAGKLPGLLTKVGLFKQETKKTTKAFCKAAKDMSADQKGYIGADNTAMSFGDVADDVQELLTLMVLLPKEKRLQLISTAKILNR